MKKIVLSIVIPTRNRKDKLGDLLDSLAKQKVDTNKWEVLIVDNGSTDGTQLVCEKWKNEFQFFRYIYDERPGLHIGRNRGLKDSYGDVIAYLDDDVILFPNWIQTAIDAFSDDTLMAANGCVIPGSIENIKKNLWKYKDRKNGFEVINAISCFWERDICEKKNTCRKQIASLLYGCNVLYRKSVLEECEGFHPDGMPEKLIMRRGDGETYISNYLHETNAKVMYFSQLSVYHMLDESRLEDKTIEKIKFRNGISDMYTVLRNSGCLSDAVKKGWNCIEQDLFEIELDKSRIKGKVKLLAHYTLNPSLREWIHKKNYL